MKNTYEFFLGGDDAEMREIKKIALKAGCVVHDKKLSWGAKVSDYKEYLCDLMSTEQVVCGDPGIDTMSKLDAYNAAYNHRYVLVELSNSNIELGSNVISIDHHGDRSGEPPAIIQVCNLLGVMPTREQCLIGAMDAGYAFGLETIGAEIAEIRSFLGATADAKTVGEILLETEGLSEEIILEAERAINVSEKIGDCIVVRCSHNKTAPITARLYDSQDSQNILILSEWEENGKKKTEANYYGNGKSVRAIAKALPGGWTGGAGLMPHTDESKKFWTQFGGCAPDTAFCGISGRPHEDVLKAVLSIVD